jgi:hypothetical protein
MKKLIAGIIASFLVVSFASAQCSEIAVSKLVNRLDKAQRALDKSNTKIENLEIQRQTFVDRKESRMAYLEAQRERHYIDLATTQALPYCLSYPAQCATQVNNLSQSIQQVNKSLANTERQFDRKIASCDNLITRLATVTIPTQEAKVALLESRVAACN